MTLPCQPTVCRGSLRSEKTRSTKTLKDLKPSTHSAASLISFWMVELSTIKTKALVECLKVSKSLKRSLSCPGRSTSRRVPDSKFRNPTFSFSDVKVSTSEPLRIHENINVLPESHNPASKTSVRFVFLLLIRNTITENIKENCKNSGKNSIFLLFT